MGILLPSLHIVKCSLERDSGNLQYDAIPLVEALLKGLNTRFNHFYAYIDVMATALHLHCTPVVLKKIAPDSVATVKEKLVNDLKTVIMSADWAEPDEQQPAPSEARSEELSEDADFLGLLGGSWVRSSPISWMNGSERKTRLHSARSCSPRNTDRRG